jgi:hypothetical protein
MHHFLFSWVLRKRCGRKEFARLSPKPAWDIIEEKQWTLMVGGPLDKEVERGKLSKPE